MLRPLACVPRDGDSPTMLRPLACVPRDGWHPMPDSHPEITIIRSLEEAHSSVTPGQDAKRTQPGDSSEQGKSASKRLTSISDAHSQRGPCRQSLVCGPGTASLLRPTILLHPKCRDVRSCVRKLRTINHDSVTHEKFINMMGAFCRVAPEPAPFLRQLA